VAYLQFHRHQEPPFIVYYYVSSADVAADNSNYLAVDGYNIELYTDAKDLAAEAAVEAQLKALGLVWRKSEFYIDTENMFEVLYQVELIGG
jgi:hypothetical protein